MLTNGWMRYMSNVISASHLKTDAEKILATTDVWPGRLVVVSTRVSAGNMGDKTPAVQQKQLQDSILRDLCYQRVCIMQHNQLLVDHAGTNTSIFGASLLLEHVLTMLQILTTQEQAAIATPENSKGKDHSFRSRSSDGCFVTCCRAHPR